jgi:hypothetical protein
MNKRRFAEIKQDQAGNWTGWINEKLVATFTGHRQATAEEIAKGWLRNNRALTPAEQRADDLSGREYERD